MLAGSDLMTNLKTRRHSHIQLPEIPSISPQPPCCSWNRRGVPRRGHMCVGLCPGRRSLLPGRQGNGRAAQRGTRHPPSQGPEPALAGGESGGSRLGGGRRTLWAGLHRRAEEGGQACWRSCELRGRCGRINALALCAWPADPARPGPDSRRRALFPWGSGHSSPRRLQDFCPSRPSRAPWQGSRFLNPRTA